MVIAPLLSTLADWKKEATALAMVDRSGHERVIAASRRFQHQRSGLRKGWFAP